MLWCAFMSLVLWIAIFRLSIEVLLAYMDDNFGHDDSPELVLYEPYNTFYPKSKRSSSNSGTSLVSHMTATSKSLGIRLSSPGSLLTRHRQPLRSTLTSRRLWSRQFGISSPRRVADVGRADVRSVNGCISSGG